MTIVNKLKLATAVLGLSAVVTSAILRGEPNPKPTLGGFNPTGVKLNEDLLGNRFSKQTVVAYETAQGETLFALQLKPALKPLANPADAPPRDLVVMVDTSASQAGKFLDASRKIVDQLSKQLTAKDRISVWVINTPGATRRLTKGLDYPKNNEIMTGVMQDLDNEYASGAVDLRSAIEKALNDFDGKVSRQQAIIYLGDAESAYEQLAEKDRYQLAAKIRETRVQFFAVPLGTAINGLTMHGLVNGTGGSVVRFSDDIRDGKKLYTNLIEKLTDALNVPVLYPTKAMFAEGALEIYPTRLPPLRADSPSLVVGKFAKGQVPAKIEGTIEGRIGTTDSKVSFSEVLPAAAPENFFLSTIVRQWGESSFKDAPAAMRADRTLALAYEQGRLTREEYLAQAEWALGANQFETAKTLSAAATKIDPDNAEVKALNKIIDKLQNGDLTLEKLKAATNNRIGMKFVKQADGQIAMERVNIQDVVQDPAPKADVPNVPVGDPKELLRGEQARRAILEQQVALTVQETLSRGRELLRGGDPKSAKDLILAQRDSIKANPDIGEALRTQLLNKMELLLADVGQRGEAIVRARAEESERVARARAKLMAVETEQARQERNRERIIAFTSLMRQARFEDAYREALVMQQEQVNEGRPASIEAQAVYEMGQRATNLREMRELTRIREDRFLLTMMQVEKSAIPFPDEPPVHFPPSKVWRDLLETRKRYASNDFEGDMPPRARRRMDFLKSALDNPIAEIDKGELPLPLLLETLAALASPPGADRDPSRRVTILVDAAGIAADAGGMFDIERTQIKFVSKLSGVALSTVLRLICEQLPGQCTYIVRRDFIEIVPFSVAIGEKVTRVFPVEDLIIGIPNAVNQSALSQSLSVLGQTFSLGGGAQGGPVVFNGNNIGGGGFQVFGGGQNNMGNNGANAAGGLFNGGCAGGISGFAGGIQGNVGSNLGGQFGFQGQDYGPILTQLITEVVARGEWAASANLFCAGGGAGGVDPPMDATSTLPPELLNSMGYWPPSRALIIRGTSRIHRSQSSKLKKKNEMPMVNFRPAEVDVVGKVGGAIAKNKPEEGPKPSAVEQQKKREEIVAAIIDKEKNLDPEKIYQMILDKGLTDPGEIIACAEFMVGCKQFKHAAELLKAGLRTGVVAEPWAQEALAIALEGSQGSKEEIERARVSAIDLAPKSPHAYVKASKAMADLGQPDRALKFCRVAAKLEPNLPDPYINAMVFAGDKKATLDSDISAWAAGNLLTRDWTIDTAEYHLRAREHLKEQSAKFTAENKLAEVAKIREVMDQQTRRDLVVELLWSGAADLDMKVREPIGTHCSSIERKTSAGGVLLCDDFAQKDDSRAESYAAAEAFDGSYQISVDKVWGRPLGNKAMIKVTRHQGTPEQSVEIHTLDLTKQSTLSFTFEGGRRKTLASVVSGGVAMDTARKPDREQQVMDKLRAMTTGTSNAMSGFGGGTGMVGQSAANAEGESPLVELNHQASIASSVPGGLQIRQETTMSKDGRKVQVKMSPVFDSAGTSGKQAKVKLDFIPGAE